MKILHIIENLDENYGGPAKSVPFLVKYLDILGIENIIFTTQFNQNERNYVIEDNNINIKKFPIKYMKKLRYCYNLKQSIHQEITKDTIIHIHTLWTYPAYVGYRSAKKFNIPVVVSTRGMLYDWALKQNSFIKQIAMLFFQKSLLKLASAIHITEPGEQTPLERLGIANKSILIPNGIDLEEFSQLSRINSKKNLNLNLTRNYVLFLSRIHPKKGLIHLVNAWVSLSSSYKNWDILVVGPVDDNNYFQQVTSILKNQSLSDRVIFTGMLSGKFRLNAFSASSLFVLPSYSENFGIVIAEALASKLPVITTTETPWRSIKEN